MYVISIQAVTFLNNIEIKVGDYIILERGGSRKMPKGSICKVTGIALMNSKTMEWGINIKDELTNKVLTLLSQHEWSPYIPDETKFERFKAIMGHKHITRVVRRKTRRKKKVIKSRGKGHESS